jgi:hypothetical protein
MLTKNPHFQSIKNRCLFGRTDFSSLSGGSDIHALLVGIGEKRLDPFRRVVFPGFFCP